MRVKPVIYAGILMAVLAWVAMMVSFWLPEVVGEALLSTSLALGIPGLMLAIIPAIFWEEIEEYHPTKKPPVLRCTDCGNKMLSPAGTTLGDQIEGEVMMLDRSQWTPPDDDPVHRRKY